MARLRCAVVGADEWFVDSLRASPLLRMVSEREAQAFLERRDDGNWILKDEVCGARPEYPALVVLRPDQLDLARDVLELYHRYSLPLRLAERCADLPGQLKLSLLACPEDGLPEAEAQVADLPEVPRDRAFGYSLRIGDGFCVQIHNASIRCLRVTLVNCARPAARSELLGDQLIDPRLSYYRFWLRSDQGSPFAASEVQGSRRYIDRMVVIGTTRADEDLRYLRSDVGFSEILARSLGKAKDLGAHAGTQPLVEKWTATSVMIGVGITGQASA